MKTIEELMKELVDVSLTGDTTEDNLARIASISNEIVRLARERGCYSPMGATEQPEQPKKTKKEKKFTEWV